MLIYLLSRLQIIDKMVKIVSIQRNSFYRYTINLAISPIIRFFCFLNIRRNSFNLVTSSFSHIHQKPLIKLIQSYTLLSKILNSVYSFWLISLFTDFLLISHLASLNVRYFLCFIFSFNSLNALLIHSTAIYNLQIAINNATHKHFYSFFR